METQNLRKKYPRFIYRKYHWNISNKNLEVFFDFKIEPNINFQPQIVIKKIDKSLIKKAGDGVLNNLIFHLGLIEMLSYWKATCPPEIEIQAGSLDTNQIAWWEDLFLQGMGQYFYENKINPVKNIPRIKILGRRTDGKVQELLSLKLSDRILVPLGGGKDSIVTLELLKQSKKELIPFCLNPNKIIKKIVRTSGAGEMITVERKIDPKLLELNRQGFLNGHTPFSAYLAFLSVFLAAIFDFKYIAFSQEKSSNEGNLTYFNRKINHQYSKSFYFENRFRRYAKKYLVKEVQYFSFLRPLYEIQIAKLFSKQPKYFPFFLSCNDAYKTNSGTKKITKQWCGKCPKCLFVFTVLYPFVDKNQLLKIFGKNLFNDKKLLPVTQELIGERGFKPFECVGTKRESLVAFFLSWEKYRKQFSANLPYLLNYFETKILPKYPDMEKNAKNILNSWDKNNNVPANFVKLLKYAQKSQN